MKRLLLVTVMTVAVFACTTLSADTVLLKNGEKIEGEVVAHGLWIEIRVSKGSVWVMRRDVVRIIRGEGVMAYVRRQLKRIPQDDIGSLKALLKFCVEFDVGELRYEVEARLRAALKVRFKARLKRVQTEADALALYRWAKDEGLTAEARIALDLRWRLRVESELRRIRCATSTAALLNLAARLKTEGVPRTYLRVIFQLVLTIDPKNQTALTELGLVLFEGVWLPQDLVCEVRKRRRHLERWEGRLQRWEADLQMQQQQLNERQRRLARWEADLSRREQQLKSALSRYRGCQVVIIRLRRDCERYRRDWEDLHRRYNAAIAEVNRLRAQLARLQRENDTLRRRVRVYESSASGRGTKCGDHRHRRHRRSPSRIER